MLLHDFTRRKSQVLLFEEKLRANGMHFELASLYRSQGKYLKAISEIKYLIKKSPCSSYKLTLADIYIESKFYEQALVHIDELLSSKSLSSKVLYVINLLKIECLIQLSRESEALSAISSQLVFDGDDELMAWRAVAHMKLNEFDEALEFYKKSIKKNNRNEKSWVGIGSIHCIKGDYDLGISCFKKALDINKKNIAAINLIEKFMVKSRSFGE